jgi:hypothetical protein
LVGQGGVVCKRNGSAAEGTGRPHKKKAKRAMELAAFTSTDVCVRIRLPQSKVVTI